MVIWKTRAIQKEPMVVGHEVFFFVPANIKNKGHGFMCVLLGRFIENSDYAVSKHKLGARMDSSSSEHAHANDITHES